MSKGNFNFLLLSIIIAIFTGCAPVNYSIPKYLWISHSEVMSKYSQKNTIVMDFGVPDKSITLDSIEVIEYSLGQINETNGTIMSTKYSHKTTVTEANKNSNTDVFLNSSGILINESNPFYINTISNLNSRTIINNQVIQNSSINYRTETVPKYVKFWFLNGKVIKWETMGIDKGYSIPNPNYSEEDYNKAKNKRSNNFLPITITILFLSILIQTQLP